MKDFKNKKQPVIAQRNNSKTFPRPLSKREKTLNERSEFSVLGVGYNPSTRKAAFTSDYRRAAFTLAEVLITLAVIGIVAVLTIPHLIQNYKKIEYSVRLKKFYSSMNQAIILSQIQNGPLDNWNKVGTIYNDKGNYDSANNDFVHDFFLKYLGPYMNYTKIEQSKIYFADGSTASMYNGGCVDFRFDVNGDKQPNKWGRDVFQYILCFNDDTAWGCGKQKRFCSYYYGRALSRTALLDYCKNDAGVCSGLVTLDGFEFKKDYPHKL